MKFARKNNLAILITLAFIIANIRTYFPEESYWHDVVLYFFPVAVLIVFSNFLKEKRDKKPFKYEDMSDDGFFDLPKEIIKIEEVRLNGLVEDYQIICGRIKIDDLTDGDKIVVYYTY